MFVADRMTKHPVSVKSNATIGEVSKLMQKNNFHRMLIIDDGKLVGYLSDRDIVRVTPSPATSLSKFEIRSLLDKLSVKDVMKTKVVTVNEDATIEEAALIMYNNKVGGLPVISEVGAVVGIITATDILKTFVNVMGLPHGGKMRITLSVNNEIGTVAAITKIFADNGVNLDSIITCSQDGKHYELVVRFDDRQKGFDEVKRQLEIHGYKVIHVAKIG
ncbi:MAG: CBS domain-containing protein [Selenomonadaceae bacterium]|nr:CBS domain-containing protein [Selenomonadaceae bacterium]